MPSSPPPRQTGSAPDSHLHKRGVTGAQLVAYALTFRGTPYVWGGSHPGGFDCSGLVQWVYGHYGISLPRTTYDQVNVGTRVAMSEVQIGDILFFDIPGERDPGHEGLALGPHTFLHAPHTGDVVKISSLSGYYVDHFDQARRIVQTAGATGSAGDTTTTGNPGDPQTAGKGSHGTPAAPGPYSVKAGPWWQTLLMTMGLPTSKNNMISGLTWIGAEGTSASWNPLATTQDSSGATNFNSVGVKNYPDQEAGRSATVKTLHNGRYTKIIADLAASADPKTTITDIANSPWGTSASDLQGSLSAVQANYQQAYNREITGPHGETSGGASRVVPSVIQDPIGTITSATGIDQIGNILGNVFSIRGLEVLGGILLLAGAGFILVRDAAPRLPLP